MGVCAAYEQGPESIFNNAYDNCQSDSEIGAITKSISKYEQKILNNTKLLLTLGYIHNIYINNKSLPYELIYLIYKFQLSQIRNKNFFMWKSKMNSNTSKQSPDFMNNYLQCRYLNPLNISNPITTNIVISDNNDKLKQINPQYSASCYVQDIFNQNSQNKNILLNNAEIKQEIIRKCEQYSISTASAIINCGQQMNNDQPQLSLNSTTYKKDYCYAVIFDDNYLNNECNNNLYGFKINLPTFTNTICDDMIYSESMNSIIGYQTFYNRFNNLYYLNPNNSNWELLTKINWKSNGLGSIIEMNNDKKLFISTSSGESVLMNMDLSDFDDLNKTGSDYIRLNTLNINKNYDDLYDMDNSLDFETFDFDTFYKPNKPIFGYNEFYKKMYRLNINKGSETENFHYDFFQNKWIKMDLLNTLKHKSKTKQIINDQSLWINDQNPNILYSMINGNDSNINFAYFDERDYAQKQWNVIPDSKIKNHSKSFNSNNNDFIVSMF